MMWNHSEQYMTLSQTKSLTFELTSYNNMATEQEIRKM